MRRHKRREMDFKSFFDQLTQEQLSSLALLGFGLGAVLVIGGIQLFSDYRRRILGPLTSIIGFVLFLGASIIIKFYIGK